VEGFITAVNRPPTREQADITLVDSPHGPYFSGSRLGGTTGAIWRVGGGVGQIEAPLVSEVVSATIDKIVSAGSGTRRKVALIALPGGAQGSGWANVHVETWRNRLKNLPDVAVGRAQFVEIDSPSALKAALGANDYQIILNPYGEGVPVWADGDQNAVVDEIRGFVAAEATGLK
jgi:hypothetical protein